jgi:hypothetical protein
MPCDGRDPDAGAQSGMFMWLSASIFTLMASMDMATLLDFGAK